MPVVPIEHTDDPRIAPYRDLQRSNLTRYSGLFVVEGALLVERLVASAFPVASVLVDARRIDLVPEGVSGEVPVYATPPGSSSRLSGSISTAAFSPVAAGRLPPRRGICWPMRVVQPHS